MPDTAALQALFAAALTVGDAAAADVTMLRGPAARAQRRLAFYRGNVQAHAHKALRNAFPVCERLVSERFFEGMAYAFAAAEPSISGDLNQYGAGFPAFIRAFEPAADLPYLSDVARLEWHVHRAHYAADRPLLDPRGLAALPPQRFAELRAALHPACALVTTATPAARIWLAHQPGSDGTFAVEMDGAPDRALVHRPLYRAEVQLLDPAAFEFLAACAAGLPLHAALEAAHGQDTGFVLDAHLAGWVRDRVIADIGLP